MEGGGGGKETRKEKPQFPTLNSSITRALILRGTRGGEGVENGLLLREIYFSNNKTEEERRVPELAMKRWEAMSVCVAVRRNRDDYAPTGPGRGEILGYWWWGGG